MLSSNAEKVLGLRYYTKDTDGKVNEDWPALSDRVSGCLANPEETLELKAYWRPLFRSAIESLTFLPNSPTLANAWARTGQLSACFVLPIADNLPDIFDAVKYGAIIHKTGGGTGFSFSRLRPKQDVVQSNRGVSSGPLSFADVFSAATETIKQGGMRRGANMGILRVDHPDILEFVSYKMDPTKLTNFNISVAITDAFMVAKDLNLDYALTNPRTGKESGLLHARTVWELVIANGWAKGEPGVVFIDRMNRYCPVPWMGQYESTNPLSLAA